MRTSSPDASTDLSAPFAIPSSEELQQLLDLAQQGRLQKLSEIAKALAAQYPEYQPWVQYLRELSEAFQVVELEVFIQKLLDPLPSPFLRGRPEK